MEITNELIEYVAALSKINLDDAHKEKMKDEIGEVIKYMDVLNELDTQNEEPMSHVFSINNVLREDVVKESFDREKILKNAPEHTDEAFVVPKTVE